MNEREFLLMFYIFKIISRHHWLSEYFKEQTKEIKFWKNRDFMKDFCNIDNIRKICGELDKTFLEIKSCDDFVYEVPVFPVIKVFKD